jgi:dTDP-4-dehydrorhamnose 3,5-epimerase
MKFSTTPLTKLILIEPDVYEDNRGQFFEAYHRKKYSDGGIPDEFVQHNQSRSRKGVLRGLHMQLKKPQGKLVRVLSGEAFDVAVDIRIGSPTFKKWMGVVLSGDNHKQLFVPPGFAHGFFAMSENVEFEYKCTEFYDKNDEAVILWNDPDIGIDWPVNDPLLSEKDKTAPKLKDILDKLPRF